VGVFSICSRWVIRNVDFCFHICMLYACYNWLSTLFQSTAL